jgi:hypothetical protein
MVGRSLYALVVVLSLVAGLEIGFLQWGTETTQEAGDREQGTGDREWRTSSPVPSSLCPVPGAPPSEEPEALVAEVPRARPERRQKKRTVPATASADALSECAREGGPLCGMPDR